MAFTLPTQPLVSRRELLRVGGAGLMGLSLARLLEADVANQSTGLQPQADACVIIFLNGGPSHLDMWDMKPMAPEGIRGEFKPIASSLPGTPLCEHLPKLAQQMRHCALVRAMNHSVNNAHALAVYTALTGHDRGDANVIVGNGSNDQPTPGAVLAQFRPTASDVPSHAALPYKTKEGAKGPPQPGFYGGLLGRSYDPLWILKDPNADDFSVPEFTLPQEVSAERLAARGELLDQLAMQLSMSDQVGRLEAMNRFQHRALELLTSQRTKSAFRIDLEEAKTRDAYGRNIYGQSVLLARRLIEAGTRVVTISWAPHANATWDTHSGNFNKLKSTLLPQFDAACGSLLADLNQRGMLERTLVAVLGDFGRTPKVNKNNAGRDHWNYCYTVMLAGGGIKPGYIHGSSDRTGAFPADRPTSPGDLLATMYRLLGVDPQSVIYDRLNRPHRLVPDGHVISELIV